MKKLNVKALLALLVAMCLLLSGVAALAEGDEPAKVEVEESGTSATVTVTEDVNTTESYGINVLVNDENPGTDTYVSVEGYNSYENRDDDGNVTKVDSLTVNAGDVEAHPDAPYVDDDGYEETMAYGVHAFVNEEVKDPVEVTVNADNVTAISDAYADGTMRATGIEAENRNQDADMTFNISGDVTAEGDRETEAVLVVGEGDTTVTVDGNVTANTTSETDGVQATGAQIEVEGGAVEVTIKGDINATDAGERAEGLTAYGEGKSASITVEGSVNADATEMATGLSVSVDGEVEVQGDVNAQAQGMASAVNAGGKAEVTVGGDVNAKASDTEGTAFGLDISGFDNEKPSVTVEGNVTAEAKKARGITAYAAETGSVDIAVQGDVTAKGEEAAGISASIDKGGEADILVEGTVSGDDVAIYMVSDATAIRSEDGAVTANDHYDFDPSAANIYVWKAEENEDGEIARVVSAEYREEYDSKSDTGKITESFTPNKEATAKLEKAIWYIVKVAESWKDKLTATGTGTYTARGKTYDLAHQDDAVLLKVSVPDGKLLNGIMYDDGTDAEYTENDDGTFTVKMKRGGGMMLSLKLKDEETEEETEETVTGEPTDEEPTTEEPTDEEPTTEEHAAEEPAAEEPAAEEPAAEEPAAEEPAAEEPAAEEPAAEAELVYKEVAQTQEVNGVKAEDHSEAVQALATVGDSIAAEDNVTVTIPGVEKVLDAEEKQKFDRLPVKDRLLVVLSALGLANDTLGDVDGMGEDAKALSSTIAERMEQLPEDEKQALLNTIAAEFPKGTVELDGVEYESFSIDLVIDRNGEKSYERYTFYNDNGTWKLFGIEKGEYEAVNA